LSYKYPFTYKLILILACTSIAVGLSGYIYIGSFMRYSGDDYCYGAVLTEFGFWDAQVYSYSNQVPFHGNRYSLTLFSTLFSLFKPTINGALPGLAIFCWIPGLICILRDLVKRSRIRVSGLEILLISEFIVFITLYAAPDLPESLYWRSGMLPYLAPIILMIYLAGLILRYNPRTRSSPFLLGLVLLLAFFGGGFSETATAFQLGLVILWFAGTSILHKEVFAFDKERRIALIFALIGTILAIILLISSPSITSELSSDGMSRNDLSSLALTMRYAWDFISDTLHSLPLPHLIILAFFATLSFLIHAHTGQDKRNGSRIFLNGVLLILAGYFLIACCILPAAFVRLVKPNPRGLITTETIMVFTIAGLGWLIGQRLASYLTDKRTFLKLIYITSFLALILIGMYPVRAAIQTCSGARHFQKWADLWDIRDANIRDAKSQNVMNVDVMHLDKVIKWVGELSADPGFWYNICAADYYGVDTISATISVWDQ